MGFDIGEATVRVLEEGLPTLPTRLEASQTVPVALWRGERYGAVLFVRLWRNGNVDSDCAITERAANGSWEQPSGWGGSGWIDDPLVRSETGWGGDPVAWIGSTGIGSRAEDENFAVAHTGLDVRALRGAASSRVAAIEVEQRGRTWTVPIESPCGAFIVGLESPGPATLRVLDRDGQPLADATGETERVA
jgi:hypothetical protein